MEFSRDSNQNKQIRQNRGDKGANTLDAYAENRLGKLT